ncbi:hypothetical protein [Synechococcus phage BUCT-ZZ01]|nr:hypothetical protein [Synechococcus phage BUCT-ZZ01]
MKTKQEKRQEALERLKKAKFEDSKAARTGTRTEQQWAEWRKKEIEKLSK